MDRISNNFTFHSSEGEEESNKPKIIIVAMIINLQREPVEVKCKRAWREHFRRLNYSSKSFFKFKTFGSEEGPWKEESTGATIIAIGGLIKELGSFEIANRKESKSQVFRFWIFFISGK